MTLSGVWRARRTVLTAVLLATPFCAALGGEDGTSDTPLCLNRSSIRSTSVLDDRNILFVMRDRRTFNNRLPKQCLGLHRGSPLAMSYSDSKLCGGAHFTVLQRAGSTFQAYTNPITNERVIMQGPSLTPAAVCALGRFVSVTADEVAELKALTESDRRGHHRGRREAVKVEPAEVGDEPPSDAAGETRTGDRP